MYQECSATFWLLSRTDQELSRTSSVFKKCILWVPEQYLVSSTNVLESNLGSQGIPLSSGKALKGKGFSR